ncbi:MAG: bacteriohemerythrin [Bacteroidetes bacterium]|nr:bacteriohemerythrin [Bacteroidota bacterium]MBU1116402.1 bacteriohemerythrin [Bacteroidota bacterium]MBU1796861.1 bacteriohemerythrin [Bacteroidota bacterium]
MAYITWKETFEIGFQLIDDQHKSFINLLNELHDAQSKGTGQHLIKEALTKFIDYTHYHFKTEEDLFKLYNYPLAAEHLEEHSYFIDKVRSFQINVQKNDLLLSLKTIDFLKDWTINHILGTDQQFSDFIRSRELGDN